MKYYLEGIKYLMNPKNELVPISRFEQTFSSYAEMLKVKQTIVEQGFKTSFTMQSEYDLTDETNNS